MHDWKPCARLLLAGLALLASARATAQDAAPKTLRYAFPIAETSFDPAQISDLYSRTVAAGIFDAPLEFDFMARPVQLRPNTAAALPEVSADFRSFTIRLKPGIFFADDPAFGGRKRELTAADYVYSIKRHYDPRWKSGNLYHPGERQDPGPERAAQAGDRRQEAVRLRHRGRGPARAGPLHLRRSAWPSPARASSYNLADGSFTGALAREVVEAYGDKIGEHPVGTGPFRLAQWKRSSRIAAAKQPELPRGAVRRAAAGRRCAAAGHRTASSRAGACR